MRTGKRGVTEALRRQAGGQTRTGGNGDAPAAFDDVFARILEELEVSKVGQNCIVGE